MDVEFDIVCDECGQRLDATVAYSKYEVTIYVEPCPKCTSDASEEGYIDGYSEGVKNAQ